MPVAIQRENAVRTAVNEEQSIGTVDAESARIGDARIVAESADHLAVSGEGENFSETGTIEAGRTGHEEGHAAFVRISDQRLADRCPPSTKSVWPVMKLASSDRRNAIAAA